MRGVELQSKICSCVLLISGFSEVVYLHKNQIKHNYFISHKPSCRHYFSSTIHSIPSSVSSSSSSRLSSPSSTGQDSKTTSPTTLPPGTHS